MTADQDAFKAASAIPGITPEGAQYLVSVSRGEGFYGLGWDNPNPTTVQEGLEYGLTGHEGKGSNNWGAVQGVGSAGSFPHVDHDAKGKKYKGTFKRYNTSTEGAADMARILLKPNVLLALANGDLHAAVMAQHANGYFELAPEKYYASVLTSYNTLTHNLAWPPLLLQAPQPELEPGSPALPLRHGFLSEEWGSQSGTELSESEVLEHAENYLNGEEKS